jgi:hypothetical protein
MAQLIDTATPTPARIEPPAAEPLPDDETAAIAAFSLVAAAHAGRLQGAMAKHIGDLLQAGAAVDHAGSGGVAEHMRPGQPPQRDAGTHQIAPHDRADRRSLEGPRWIGESEAVDAAFCSCVTLPADASIGRTSPVHEGLIAEVARLVRAAADDSVDTAPEQSFPASDPPAWIWRA